MWLNTRFCEGSGHPGCVPWGQVIQFILEQSFLYQNWWQQCCRNFGKTPSLATMFTASCHITRALWTQTYNLWSHLQLVFELSQVLAAWKGCLSRAQGIDGRARTHVQHAKILQQEDAWPVEVDPNFGRGAYGLEDVPLTGKFPNKRDERTINIHISSPASKRRWIVTVSSSWYKPRDAWHLLWMRPNVIQTTWPIRVDWSRDIGRFYTKDAAIIRLDELGQTFCSSSGYASQV